MRIRTRIATAASVLLAALGGLGVARSEELPEDWLPNEVRQVFAQRLAEQIRGVPGFEEGEAEVLEKARATIDGIAESIRRLGIEGLIEMAPAHPGLELPGEAPPPLVAIGRFGLCSAFLQEVYHDVNGSGYSIEDRVSSAVGLAVLPLVSGPLREVLLAQGLTDEQMKAYLGGEDANALFQRVWNDRELLAATRDQCNPAIRRLVVGS